MNILRRKTLALFCSKKCPGNLILKTYDLARNLRDTGVTVISGFHSPVEKECLNILLKGRQPIIVCPARSLEGIRLPCIWKKKIEEGKMLLLSSFPSHIRRATAETAVKRNIMAAAIADEVCFIHIEPGGSLEELKKMVTVWVKEIFIVTDKKV